MLSDLRFRLRALFQRSAMERELDAELRFHLEREMEKYVRTGLSRAAAERRARIALGGVERIKDDARDARGIQWIDSFVQDFRYAARGLRSKPVFTVAAILTLALGIGANAAVFSVINAVLLRPLPFPGSEQLVAVYTRFQTSSGSGFPYFALSGPEFADLRSRVATFDGLAGYGFVALTMTRESGDAERVLAMRVTSGFFDVLGVKPVGGRTFTHEEAQGSEGCLALVAHDASDRGTAIDSTIRLDDAPCRVIGLMPQGFAFRNDQVKVWTALRVDTDETPINRGSHGLAAIARVRAGVSAQQVDAQLQALHAYWSEQYPDHHTKGHFVVTRPLHEDVVGNQRDALLLLGGAVVFVLLIVCVNLAALLVSNGEARRREFALRQALGAHRRRLMRQLLTESLLLAGIGGVIGIVLAHALLAGLLAFYPQRLPLSQAITIDYIAVLYACALVIVAGFLIALVPAVKTTGGHLQETLRADSRTATASLRAVAARSVLVVSQLALSVILLVGAVLLIRSYQQLQQVDLGFEPDHLLTLGLFIPPGRQPDAAAARRTLAAIEDRLAAIPGVVTAGAVSNLPLVSPGPPDAFVIEGRPQPPPGAPGWNARYLMATPRMFAALRIPLKRGRVFVDSDAPGRPLVAVINETAARLYWPGDDPIGRTIRYYPLETSPSIHIVGVVGDVRSMGAGQPAPPAVYVPFQQAPRPPYEGRAMTFIVRVRGSPVAVTASARAAVAVIDAGLPLANVQPMSELVSISAGQPRFTTLVMSFFAGVAFFLAALGLYGVLAYSVQQRTREIGVRVALGAEKREIFQLIIGNGMRLALVGVIVGVPAALALTRLMGGTLSGITSTDPVTYIAVVAMLATATLLASYLPARRATRVDPMTALRTE